MKRNGDLLPPLEWLNDGWQDGEELRISDIDSQSLHDPRGSFVVMLIEADSFYVKNPTKSKAFHAPRFFLFGKQLLKKLYDLSEEFNELMKPCFLEFVNRKVI